MKNKICATLTKDHIYICSGGVIGRSGENECTQLEITLDECLCDKWIYIDFSKPDGTTYKTSKLDVIDNKVIYDIPNSLLEQKGQLKVQVVLQDENGEVWKSTIKSYEINPSINATDDIPNQDDFITEAQKLLNEAENLDLDITEEDEGVLVVITKKDGTKESVIVSNGGSGTTDYFKLKNKPSINGIELLDNKTTEDLGIIEDVRNYIDENKEVLRGQDGYTPVKGVDYFDGVDGYTPVKDVDYFDGKDGKDGENGKDGYTPIKGVDYFDGKDYILTETDKNDIAKLVEVNTPTKVSELENDSKFVNEAYVNNIVGNIEDLLGGI